MSETQSLKNHARFDPAFHFFLFALYILNLVYASFHLYRQPSLSSGWYLVLSLLAVVPLLKLRTYPLKLQPKPLLEANHAFLHLQRIGSQFEQWNHRDQ